MVKQKDDELSAISLRATTLFQGALIDQFTAFFLESEILGVSVEY